MESAAIQLRRLRRPLERRRYRQLLRGSSPRTSVAVILLISFIGCKKYDHVLAQTTNLRAVSIACQLYHASYGTYPDDLHDPDIQPFLGGDFASLDDEWGNAIRYQLTDTGFTLTSFGPDEQFATDDDIHIAHAGPGQ